MKRCVIKINKKSISLIETLDDDSELGPNYGVHYIVDGIGNRIRFNTNEARATWIKKNLL